MREPVLRELEHLVGDSARGVLLEAIDPAVPHPIRELLLLPVEDFMGEVFFAVGTIAVEGLSQQPLLDVLLLRALVDHLDFGVKLHDDVEEVLVQEWHPHLQPPGHSGLVGAKAVIEVEVLDLAHTLLVQLLAVRRLVEVEVAAELLVGTLTGEHHLHAHRLDLTGEEEEGGARADSGHVVRLEVVNHVLDSVDALLDGEVELVVLRPEHLRHLLGVEKVGGANEADGEGDGGRDALGLAHLHHARRHQGRVEAAGEEDTVGHVGHEALLDGGDQRVAHQGFVEGLGRVRDVEPLGVVVLVELHVLARPVVPGRERLDRLAVLNEAFHFRREPD
mmetsp:Transcript_10392/g.25345  ORF Transcript_10392/g.25345 Transcript_10392/m.25345 type:complete len:334 (-) Transcript_10392:712-1713(-)